MLFGLCLLRSSLISPPIMMSWECSYFNYISWSSSMHSWYSTWWLLLPLTGICTHIIITFLFAPSSSIHWIFSEPSGRVLTRWSMFFFYKIATPPYPLGNDNGRRGSFISTPFATNVQLKCIPIGSIQMGICAKLESGRCFQTGLFY